MLPSQALALHREAIRNLGEHEDLLEVDERLVRDLTVAAQRVAAALAGM